MIYLILTASLWMFFIIGLSATEYVKSKQTNNNPFRKGHK